MKRRGNMWIVFLVSACLLAASGCQQQGQQSTQSGTETTVAEQVETTVAETEAPTVEETQEAAGDRASAQEISDRLYQELAENMLEYAPVVKTLESGVQVQRTPDGQGIFNTYYAKADERGCYACHDDLNEVLQGLPRNLTKMNWMPSTHLSLDYVGDMKVTVTQCIECHTGDGENFNTYIHALHKTQQFTAMGGSCESCHHVTDGTGEWVLWDEVKYDVLTGIVSADATQGEFTWDQDTVIDQDELFVMDWLYEANDFERYEALKTGDNEGQTDLMESWNIQITDVDGSVKEISLTELIANVPSVTTPLTMQCVINVNNAGLIGNVMVTGLPVEDILAYAGVSEGVKSVYIQNFVEEGIYPTPINLEWTEDHDVLFVYEINGNPLRVEDGYPVMLWTGGMGASSFKKQAYSITCSAEEVDMMWPDYQPKVAIPNQGVMYTQEGQIIEVGVPYTFEGFAFAYTREIASVEFSLDKGQTWATFETEGAIDQAWVYWHYTFTPQEPGAYLLYVRCTTTDGLVSEKPFEIMVNAK